MLNIILTSYNRPALLQRALNSLLAQTSTDWKCYLQDDDSNAETLAVLGEYMHDERVIVRLHTTTDRTGTRYSILINEILPTLTDGIVGYLCDNVEYRPDLVAWVTDWFDRNPYKYSGYVMHERDVWAADGSKRLGTAAEFGHWNILPPVHGPILTPNGWLDHSQVFHRLPCKLLWSESPAVKLFGDGEYFTRLVMEHGPIYPIHPEHVYTVEHLLEDRV